MNSRFLLIFVPVCAPQKHLPMPESEPATVPSWSEKEMKPRQLLDGKAVQKEKRTQVLCCAQNAQHEL